MGLLGTVLGFIRIFAELQSRGTSAQMEALAGGIWQALICTAAGLAVAIPAYAGYNYLVSRVNAIVLDMEKAATEIVNIVAELPTAHLP
jgi:biopolymer transport protein ExbB